MMMMMMMMTMELKTMPDDLENDAYSFSETDTDLSVNKDRSSPAAVKHMTFWLLVQMFYHWAGVELNRALGSKGH